MSWVCRMQEEGKKTDLQQQHQAEQQKEEQEEQVESNMMESDVEKETQLGKTGIQYPDLTGQLDP